MRQMILASAMLVVLSGAQACLQAAEMHRTSVRTAAHTYYGGGSSCDGCASRGCGIATCEGTCNLCAPCCPRLLPSLLRSIDCLLQQAFCNPCNIPVCRPRPCAPTCCSEVWSGYGSGCGCAGGHSENWSPAGEGNPFVDDELQLPPTPPKEARIRRSPPKAAMAKRASVPQSRAAKPVKIAKIGEPTPAVRKEVSPKSEKTVQITRAVKPIAHETTSSRAIPKNPLRDE